MPQPKDYVVLSVKRSLEFNESDVPLKKMRSNEQCSAHTITTIKTKENEIVLLRADDICLNDKKCICLLDSDRIIILHNDNYEEEIVADIPKKCVGARLTFHEDIFYVTEPQKHTIYKISGSQTSKIRVRNPKLVRFYRDSMYILSSTCLLKMVDNVPRKLFEEEGSEINFSDFFILNNVAFILDSVVGTIFSFELTTSGTDKPRPKIFYWNTNEQWPHKVFALMKIIKF